MAESVWQQQLLAKLTACRADGVRIHGNLIETYELEGEVMISVVNNMFFHCLCWYARTLPC